MDPREAAQRVLAVLDDFAKELGTNPQAGIGLAFFGPESPVAQDVMILVNAVINGPPTAAISPYPQPSTNGQYNMQQQPQQPTQQFAPDLPLGTTNMRENFLTAMRDSGMFPNASDQTVPPQVLAIVARTYMTGRVDEMRRIPGTGWQMVERWQREYAYMLRTDWVPDVTWKWWAVAPTPAQPFRVPGGIGDSLAAHMAAPPQWGQR